MTNKKSPIKHFLEVTLQGVFWLLPIVAVVMIVLWLYNKVDLLAHGVFTLIGFAPQNDGFLWLVIVVAIFLLLLYLVGHLMETRVATFLETLISKIPGYSTIKDIIGIFNSSKKGETQVLVVAIRGFANEGYNIGLMYSQKESIIKEHYTVTLSQTPIPNGGYMFEVHKDNIFVIEEAKFDDNLKYLLSMGVKSMSDIVKIQPKQISDFISLSDWLGRKNGLRD
ncbi:DUF502 domain-containing protein [Candidatus Sulfurimonas baltica]|uniref:DUF502 domain-containing protein n=1 Tax=Candidatus Sulfurimonas baltica TaxID=2740404 RepID=A0A7S7LTH3_9BACT|nr:DUF502 domain-containing protein [Candidatus Sulfurimonas baltica]QOY51070.1 DUF502 domain-containing protein [Candidatus Sulfurimonas baltica]